MAALGYATSAVEIRCGSFDSPNGRMGGSNGGLVRPTSLYHDRVNTLLLFIQSARRDGPAWAPGEFQSMVAHLAVGCVVAVVVFRLVPRVAWPRPFSWRFAALHVIAAPAVTAVWLFASLPIERLVGGVSDVGFATRFKEMMEIGRA